MDSSRSRIPSAAAHALGEALRRPPLRVSMRHEPTDRIDAYPTLALSPCGTASALHALDRATRHSGTRLLVGGASLLDDRTSSLTNATRDRLASQRVGSSILADTAGVIELGRTTDTRLTIASVEGPVDDRDAKAIESAIAGATPPIDADLRAVAVVQCGVHRQVWAQFRDIEIARRFLASLLRQYVARVSDLEIDLVPELDLESIRLPTPGFVLRPRDVRLDGCEIATTLRSAAGRATLTLTADRSTGRWYA